MALNRPDFATFGASRRSCRSSARRIRTVLPAKRRGSAAPCSLTLVAALDDVDQRQPARRAAALGAEPERRRGERAAADAGGVDGRLTDDRVEQRACRRARSGSCSARRVSLSPRDDLRAGRRAHAQRERRDRDVRERVEDRLQRRLQHAEVARRRERLGDVDVRRVDRLRVEREVAIDRVGGRELGAEHGELAETRAAGDGRAAGLAARARLGGHALEREQRAGRARSARRAPGGCRRSRSPGRRARRRRAAPTGRARAGRAAASATDSSPRPADAPATCESGSAPVKVVRAKSAPPVTGERRGRQGAAGLLGGARGRAAIGGDRLLRGGGGDGHAQRAGVALERGGFGGRGCGEQDEHGRADGERQSGVHGPVSRSRSGNWRAGSCAGS